MSLFTPGQEFDLWFALSYKKYVYKQKSTDKFVLNDLDYFWNITGLKYDPNIDYLEESNVTIPIDDKILKENWTLYLYMEIEADYSYKV